jgi:hypothetical protein
MANTQVLASDNWAGGSLSASWAVLFGILKGQVVGTTPKLVEPNATSTEAGQIWTALGVLGEQNSAVVVQTLTNEAGTFLSLHVRFASGTKSGYRMDIANAKLNIYRWDAGTPTHLGATDLAITAPVAGDVIRFQAAGAALTVYINGRLIESVYDGTYTTGYPGFSQYSSVAIAHTQVASWACYSNVNQDGIWQKQGVTFAPITGDLPNGIQCHSPIIYEGNAQILSGTVYKMWFDNFTSMYYAESTDGITWTRKAASLLGPGLTNTSVFKVGSTYYAYVEQNSNANGPIQAYTSSDGITFTQQNASAIAIGGVGTWDHANLGGIFALTVVAGTWYAYYGGCANLATTPFSSGLATSTDGITWTKYVSNPVLSQKGNFFGLVVVNGKYYTWVQSNQPGQGSAAPFFDPVESIRYVSTDLLTWTLDSHSTQNTQGFESYNSVTGYATGGNLIDVGGVAYNYLTVGTGDVAGAIVGQVQLAIGPAATSSIVTKSESAWTQVATDGFTSGNGDLSGNWVTPTGGTKLKIVSTNLCEPTAAATNCQMLYTGTSFSNDQYSEITIATMGGEPDFCQPIVRGQTGAKSFYAVLIAGPTGSAYAAQAYIYKVVSGSSTQLSSTAPQITPQVGDVFRLQAVGSSPVQLSFYQNGFLILTAEDWSNAFTSGSPGIQQYAQTTLANAQLSLWAGGNAAVIPTYGITVSGTIVDSHGAALSGVTVAFTGQSSTTTDGSGNYSFAGIVDGSYTITPSKTNYNFVPQSTPVTVSGVDVPGENFTAYTNVTSASGGLPVNFFGNTVD